jgi:hypothetical protein
VQTEPKHHDKTNSSWDKYSVQVEQTKKSKKHQKL